MERFSTTTSVSTMGPEDSRHYKEGHSFHSIHDHDDSADFGPVFAEQMQVKLGPGQTKRQTQNNLQIRG